MHRDPISVDFLFFFIFVFLGAQSRLRSEVESVMRDVYVCEGFVGALWFGNREIGIRKVVERRLVLGR